MGRPTKMTPDTLDKLRTAFLIGATDAEACGFADITDKTLYNYQDKHPEYLHQKQAWKDQPILKAKTTVVNSLDEVKDAQWYLERKVKNEFSQRTELTGEEGKDITVKIVEDTELKDANRPTD